MKAKNNAGIGKSTTKLIICTLKENYDTYEKYLTTVEPSDLIGTKYEEMSYRDILSLNDSNEILIRCCIGLSVLFSLVIIMAVFNK